MRALAASLLLLLVDALTCPYAAMSARPQPPPEPLGVTGQVLAPDGTPVSDATVRSQSGFASATSNIEAEGRFRFLPARPGFEQVLIAAPGFAPFRIDIVVPPSRSLRLPPIRLDRGAFFRVRLVSAEGEPIIAPQLRRRMFDAGGRPMFDGFEDRSAIAIDDEGAITIGPLPRGVLTSAVDMPLFARTRLADANVADSSKVVDGGTVTIQQPGAVLHVDLVDGTGAAVPDHEVRLEDARPRSPLVIDPARTNRQGRVTFERLAAGRYRVWTTASDRCPGAWVATSRDVLVPVNKTIEVPVVIGGRAKFRITSPLGPAAAVLVSASPDVPAPPAPFASRVPTVGCRAMTDADGRVGLSVFPPGPAHVQVQKGGSTYVRPVEVPSDGREVAIAIPDGLLPVRVLNEKSEPITGAAIAWTGGGARIEAMAMATGDALLEGVGTAGGTLTVSARGYRQAEQQFAEPPGILYTIALVPLPPPAVLRARVVTSAHEPLPNAVVEMVVADPGVVPRVAATDAKGVVTFGDLPAGSMELIVSAEGFATATMRLAKDAIGDVVVTLRRER